MTFAAPRRFGIAAFALGLLPALAAAQTDPAAKGGRAWTDPPARETAGPKVEAPKPVEAVKAATVPAAQPSAPRPGRTKAASVRPAPRAKVAARAPVPRRQVVGTAPRLRGPGQDSGFRVVTVRPRSYVPAPVIRYGYVVGEMPVRPMVYDDGRAARIRQAEEAGYLVVRSRSVEFPDGRRLRTYRPVDADADD